MVFVWQETDGITEYYIILVINSQIELAKLKC